MTQPTAADSHVVQVLTDWAMQYADNEADYKADLLAPALPSKKRDAKFYTYDKAAYFTDEMKKRAEGDDVPMAGYTLSTTLFEIDTWSLGKPIDDQTRDNEDDILDSDQDATQFLMQKERIRREIAFADACLATGKWGTDVTGNTSTSDYTAHTVKQWNEATGTTPLQDVANYRRRMKEQTGLWGNVLVLGAPVWDILKYHAAILDAIKGGATSERPAKATLRAVAEVLELEEIVVMDAIKNTALAPKAMSGSFIGGKHGLLMHRNMNAGRKGATAVKMATWQRPGCDNRGFRILKSKKNIHVDIVEVESNFTPKICATDLGYFLNGLIA